MDFASALLLVLDGHCVARPGWRGDSYIQAARAAPGIEPRYLPLVVRRAAAGFVLTGQATAEDMTATDWILVEPT